MSCVCTVCAVWWPSLLQTGPCLSEKACLSSLDALCLKSWGAFRLLSLDALCLAARTFGPHGSLTLQAVGDTLKDGFHVVHGAGDELRGDINSALDGFGDSIAGRDAAANNRDDRVAQRGAAEAEAGRQGLEQDKGERRV